MASTAEVLSVGPVWILKIGEMLFFLLLLSKVKFEFQNNDKYANCIPNPERIPKYTKVKVLHTQDKQCIHWAAWQSYAATATAL